MKKLLLLLLFIPLVYSCSKDPIIYTLTTSANPSDGGTVSPLNKQYNEGETATINAIPAAEYVFQSWSGASGSSSTASVVMSSDKSVTANFVKKKYALTTSVEGEGTITEKIIKAGAATDYNSGTIVELTATPSNGWKFKEWNGDLTGTDNPKQITIDKAKTVKAVFEALPPFYLDANGVTIKARDWVTVGTVGNLNDVTFTAVDNPKLREMVNKDEDVTKVVTTLVTTMVGIFEGALSFNQDISKWDVSNVTNMQQMFLSCRKFNQDISKWDVSNVTNMKKMFSDATLFNQPIGDWDVSNVTDMSDMFGWWFRSPNGQGNTSPIKTQSNFNQPIGDWDVSSVTIMDGMFSKAMSFNQPIGDWDVSNVTEMGNMFKFNKVFNQDISKWDVSKVENTTRMFLSCRKFNQDISKWDMSKVKNMNYMFYETEEFNQPIGDWDTANVTAMLAMFMKAMSFNQPIGDWNTAAVNDMTAMFRGASNFNQDIGNWNTASVTKMKHMFYEAQTFNQDLSLWNTNKVKMIFTNSKLIYNGCYFFSKNTPNWILPKAVFVNCDVNRED